ncbi:MAG: DUF2059 domain-containing protein [Hyphomonadaceae bacterium]
MIRKFLLAGATLVILAACNAASGSGTPVPKTDADKQKLAGEIATMMSDPKMFDNMFDSMSASMTPVFDNLCNTVPADKKADCPARMAAVRPLVEETMKESKDQVKALMPDMMKDMGDIMASTYTGEELAKMHDFYSSPEGRAIVQKQPQVMAQYMPKAMQRMQAVQMDMMQKMQKRVAEALGAATAPPN